jgi:SAM-dependent methyltransferase
MEKTEPRWDETWATWDKPAWPASTNLRIDWFLKAFQELKASAAVCEPVIVEVGTGSGWVARESYHVFEGRPYICADISSLALERIRNMELPAVTTCLMDELEALGKVADLLVCGDVLEHVEDRPKFFAQIRSVMKEGGIVPEHAQQVPSQCVRRSTART